MFRVVDNISCAPSCITRPRASTEPERLSPANASNSLPDSRRLQDDRAGTGRLLDSLTLLASIAVNAVLIF